jgi:hypothetical protein
VDQARPCHVHGDVFREQVPQEAFQKIHPAAKRMLLDRHLRFALRYENVIAGGGEVLGQFDTAHFDCGDGVNLWLSIGVLVPAARFNPTAFQAVSFQLPVPRPRQRGNGGIQA